MNKDTAVKTDEFQIKLSRRQMLKTLLAAGVLSATGLRLSFAEEKGSILKRKIPSNGEMIPAVGLGSSDTFEVGAGESKEPLAEVLRLFIKRGGRVVDTAPSYGNAESVIGEMSSELGVTDKLFIATKVDRRGREEGIEQMKKSEQLLNTKPLNLIQVHNLIDVETQLNTLRRWKEEGRVRYIGITHYRVSAHDELEKLMKSRDMDFVQFNYSVLSPEAEKTLLPLAADRGIAVIANRPFVDGALFTMTAGKRLPEWAGEFDCKSWAQFSLKYILSHPAVTCAIPATSNPKHLVDNMGAGFGKLPDEKTRKRMRDYMVSI